MPQSTIHQVAIPFILLRHSKGAAAHRIACGLCTTFGRPSPGNSTSRDQIPVAWAVDDGSSWTNGQTADQDPEAAGCPPFCSCAPHGRIVVDVVIGAAPHPGRFTASSADFFTAAVTRRGGRQQHRHLRR
ncbi:hypothetical protein DAPPUDRAFT_101431 [Daphnia pulex]|uniref:Uncharacterized protein n=1 Tax=Daphnia pulex TaxID=6669 RepID=E9GDC4_DAPPU|nr:hypothetical protein DAPPUDRAFT_101431 [Daphnia pulex]|eukprot:EFX82715.1 hypothetical protein DAPPUDRAFT_101431 [Daphnia pulex]